MRSSVDARLKLKLDGGDIFFGRAFTERVESLKIAVWSDGASSATFSRRAGAGGSAAAAAAVDLLARTAEGEPGPAADAAVICDRLIARQATRLIARKRSLRDERRADRFGTA